MGGSLSVQSTSGAGACFSFTFVTSASAAQRGGLTAEEGASSANSANSANTQHALTGLRVLLVDDNATNLRILGLQAARWGMKAKSHLTPAGALEELALADSAFDVMITDMCMPGMDGVELVKKAAVLRPAMPVILLSSISMRQSPDAHLFSAVLMKPARQSSFFDAIVRAVASTDQPLRVAPAPLPPSLLDGSLAVRLPLRVLLAEDNPVNQQLALRILKGFGYLADLAANGLEVMTALKRQRYDLVLMDVQMPELDGIAATRQILSAYPEGERPVIIAMSANALREDIDAALAAGMNDYVTKPIVVSTLKAMIEKWGVSGLLPHKNKASVGADEVALPPLLDNEQLNTILGYDSSATFLRELVASFTTNGRELIGKLQAASAAQDAQATQRIAHQLKGTSGSLGALRLMELCAQIELQSRGGELTHMTQLVALLDPTMGATLALFDALLAKHKG
jgi:CheY-like chemotaxis protein